jgi:hypothetical protein
MKTETLVVLASLITAAAVNLDAGRETRAWVESVKADVVSYLVHQGAVGEVLGYRTSGADVLRQVAEVEAAGAALQKEIELAVKEAE